MLKAIVNDGVSRPTRIRALWTRVQCHYRYAITTFVCVCAVDETLKSNKECIKHGCTTGT